jgi:hypothetical protein
MRSTIFILFLLVAVSVSAQKQYYCVYRDEIPALIPDSVFNSMKADTQNRNMQAILVSQLLAQLSKQKNNKLQERTVTANQDSTVITFDRRTIEGDHNDANDPGSILLKKGELYEEAPAGNGFSKTPVTVPAKSFLPAGTTKRILLHSCKEYFSTDSTCRIWIAEDLPSYINPGIRTGNMKGAVLAFEIKTASFFLKSEIIKIQ